MSHPRFAGLVAAAFSIALAVGCAGATPPGQGPASTSGDTPQYGGTLRVPARPTFQGKDPYAGPTGSQLGLKSRPVYEPLVAYKLEPGVNFRAVEEVVPWLASRWEQPNPAEYLFTIRQGVKWQDGRDMTTEDVVYSIKRAVSPTVKYGYGTALAAVMKDVELQGKDQVRLTLNGARPGFLFDAIADYIKILPKHVEEQGKNFDEVVVGTGPFKMVTLDNQRGITFERNVDYWDKGRPYLDGVVVFKGLDDSAIQAALATAQMDVYNPGLLADLTQAQSMVPDLRYAEYTESYSNAVFMQLNRPPYNDIRVRRALHLGLDRQKLIATGLQGKGLLASPMSQPDGRWAIPQKDLEAMPGFNAQSKQRDVQEAKRLLAEAGFPNGFPMELIYRPSLSSSNAIAEPLASAWRTDLGIQVTLKPLESGVFENARRDGSYQAVLTTTNDKPIDGFYEYFYSQGPYMKYGLNDPELDRLILAAQTEPDEDKRVEMGRQMQRTVIDKLYAIPTVERFSYAAWQPWINGYLFNPGAQVIPFYTPAITWIDQSKLPESRKNEKLPF